MWLSLSYLKSFKPHLSIDLDEEIMHMLVQTIQELG